MSAMTQGSRRRALLEGKLKNEVNKNVDQKIAMVVAVLKLLSTTAALGAMGDLIVSGHGTISEESPCVGCAEPIKPIVVKFCRLGIGTLQLTQGGKVVFNGTVTKINEFDESYVVFEVMLPDENRYRVVASTTKDTQYMDMRNT